MTTLPLLFIFDLTSLGLTLDPSSDRNSTFNFSIRSPKSIDPSFKTSEPNHQSINIPLTLTNMTMSISTLSASTSSDQQPPLQPTSNNKPLPESTKTLPRSTPSRPSRSRKSRLVTPRRRRPGPAYDEPQSELGLTNPSSDSTASDCDSTTSSLSESDLASDSDDEFVDLEAAHPESLKSHHSSDDASCPLHPDLSHNTGSCSLSLVFGSD